MPLAVHVSLQSEADSIAQVGITSQFRFDVPQEVPFDFARSTRCLMLNFREIRVDVMVRPFTGIVRHDRYETVQPKPTDDSAFWMTNAYALRAVMFYVSRGSHASAPAQIELSRAFGVYIAALPSDWPLVLQFT